MLDGYALAHGLGYLQELPADRFVNFVWYMLTRNAEQAEIDKVKRRLWQPPKGVIVSDPRSPWSAQAETDSLRAFKASAGGAG